MNIERVKIWQWALLGLVLGLGAGWSWTNLREAGGLETGDSIDSATLARAIELPAIQGHPWVKDLVLHRGDGRFVLTLKRLVPDPREKHPEIARRYLYVPARLAGGPPFCPSGPRPLVKCLVEFGRHPRLTLNGSDPRGQSGIELSGWKPAGLEASDPGSGATISLPVRAADHRLQVRLAGADAEALTDLSVRVNGQPAPPLVRMKGRATPTFEAVLPKSLWSAGPTQTIEFARKAKRIEVRSVLLEDATFSIADYLAFVHQRDPRVTWTSAWWDEPGRIYAICGAAGVLIVGGVWPVVLRLLIGAGFGPVRKEPEYDLSRFGTKPPTGRASATAGDDGLAALAELEARLEAELADAGTIGSARPAPAEAPPAPVALPGTAQPAPVAVEHRDEPAEYAGEYYPVARKPAEHSAGDSKG